MYDEIINEIMRKAKMKGFLVFVGVPLEDANLRKALDRAIYNACERGVDRLGFEGDALHPSKLKEWAQDMGGVARARPVVVLTNRCDVLEALASMEDVQLQCFRLAVDHEPPHPAFLDDICEAPRVLQLLGPDFL